MNKERGGPYAPWWSRLGRLTEVGDYELERLFAPVSWSESEVELVEVDGEQHLAYARTTTGPYRYQRTPSAFQELKERAEDRRDGEAETGSDERDQVLNDFLRLVGGRWPPQTFEEFEENRAEDVLEYARTYGLLEVCEDHIRPVSHDEFCQALNPEPLRVWWRYAKLFQAVLGLAAKLHRGETGNPENWDTLREASKTLFPDYLDLEEVVSQKGGGLTGERLLLVSWVQRLVRLADFHVVFVWDPASGIEIRPMSHGHTARLFSNLVKHTAFAVCRSDGFAMCSGCGRAYLPDRRPRKGERNFCRTCRADKVPERLAKRDHRWRERHKTEYQVRQAVEGVEEAHQVAVELGLEEAASQLQEIRTRIHDETGLDDDDLYPDGGRP